MKDDGLYNNNSCPHTGVKMTNKPDAIKAALSVGKPYRLLNIDKALEANVYERQIWNEAIEVAALIVQPNPHIEEERKCQDIADQIRKIKK